MSIHPLEADFLRRGQPRESSRVVAASPVMAAPTSPEWWVQRLFRALSVRNVRLHRLQSYYLGTNSTWELASRAHRDTFGTSFRDLRANLARPVVEVPEQRLRVIGLTIWDDDAGSAAAWDIWTQNQLEALSSEAHLSALSTGICPVIVSTAEIAPGIPLVTVEDPLSVYVEHDAADSRTRRAALKVWAEDDGRRTAILYLPDVIEWWQTEHRPEDGTAPRWRRLEAGGPNPLGVVPVVELRNAPRAEAEHEGVIDQLRVYAHTLYNMVTAAHYAAYPQRWAAGVEQDEEATEVDADGHPISSPPAGAQSGPDTTITTESPDAKFGSFATADLAGFVRLLEAQRADIGTISHTPHRLLVPPPTSVPPSGESVRLADAPLTAKVQRKMVTLGNGWETVMRLAFLASGDQLRARRMDLETEWADPELHTESEHMDALVKMQAMGVPQEELWRRMGASPQQIRRWKAAQPGETTDDRHPAVA